MRTEFMNSMSNGPLIRLFDFSSDEVTDLKKSLEKLTKGLVPTVELHRHCEGCHLTFILGEVDEGISGGPFEFTCVLTENAYNSMIELLNSFALHPSETKGFEWLDETNDISLLISPDKNW